MLRSTGGGSADGVLSIVTATRKEVRVPLASSSSPARTCRPSLSAPVAKVRVEPETAGAGAAAPSSVVPGAVDRLAGGQHDLAGRCGHGAVGRGGRDERRRDVVDTHVRADGRGGSVAEGVVADGAQVVEAVGDGRVSKGAERGARVGGDLRPRAGAGRRDAEGDADGAAARGRGQRDGAGDDRAGVGERDARPGRVDGDGDHGGRADVAGGVGDQRADLGRAVRRARRSQVPSYGARRVGRNGVEGAGAEELDLPLDLRDAGTRGVGRGRGERDGGAADGGAARRSRDAAGGGRAIDEDDARGARRDVAAAVGRDRDQLPLLLGRGGVVQVVVKGAVASDPIAVPAPPLPTGGSGR